MQRLKGASPMAQQRGSTLTLTNVSDADAAAYSVVVTNVAGNVTSTAATLTVVDAPQLTIIRAGLNVTLRWPTNATGFTLKSTTNLASPVWTNSPAPVVVNG